jgi:hypothetical protein
MMIEPLEIQIGIYRRDPGAHVKVTELEYDVGLLLGQFVQEPRYFSNDLDGGAIKVEMQRTHEFEIVIGLALVGSGIFLKGTLEEMGKRFGGWLADIMGRLGTKQKPEVRCQGHTTVVVDPSAMNECSASITKLVTEAAQAGTRVLLIVEPGIPGLEA